MPLKQRNQTKHYHRHKIKLLLYFYFFVSSLFNGISTFVGYLMLKLSYILYIKSLCNYYGTGVVSYTVTSHCLYFV